MDNGKKNATRILTTNDIREDARNWTLAGDVGLLAHLEQFSENIINRTQETQKRFTDLVDDYEELYTKIGNVTNQFLALQNCQFVENRVYDEETPTEEKAEVKVKDEVEQEKLLLMQYKEAVEVGIKLLDTHFQEVQLPPNSDSDDDDDEVSNGNSVIWKPKNPYAEKKFPLLIGSAEWWADDHVGLGTEEDVLDTEKMDSDSETDMESLKSVEKETKSSSSSMENIKSIPTKPAFLGSSSEDIFGVEKSGNLKSSVSDDFIFKRRESFPEQTEDFLPDFDRETEKMKSAGEDGPPAPVDDGEEKPSAAVNPKKVDNAFTRELMAKLSSVSTKKESGVKEIEKKVNEKEIKANEDEGLFDDTDDGSDLFSAKVQERAEENKEGRSLFFETENDDDLFRGDSDLFSGRSLFGPEKPKRPQSPSVTSDVSEAPKESQKKPRPPITPNNGKASSPVTTKNSAKTLFDDLEDDDTLFTARPAGDISSSKSGDKVSNKSVYSAETNVTLKKTQSDITTGLVWNTDDALFGDADSHNSFSAPVEDDLFSSSALFDPRVDLDADRSTESRSKKFDEDLFSEEPPKVVKKENFEEFDSKFSSERETSSDLFGLSPAKKIGILDSEDDDDDDLFSKGLRDKRPALKATAFAADDDDAALFGEPPKLSDAVSMSSSRSSLFDDVSASKSRLGSVFEKDKGSAGGGEKAEEDLFSVSEDSLFGGEKKRGSLGKEKREKEKSSLFGEYDDDDDLFGGERSTGVEVQEVKISAKGFVDDTEDDLFKASGGPTKLRETKSDILRKSEHKLFVDDEDDADLFSTSSSAKPKPPSTLRLKDTESEAKGKTVGKLNIPDNLKVRFESVAKRISPGALRPSAEEEEEKDDKKEKEDEREEEKRNDVLDEPPPSSNLLKCPSKDRVKIPGRRRPQSRRARQEALRASGTWDQPSSTPAPAPASAPLSNPLSPSTDEEDFFKVPELDTNFEKEDQSIFKNDLFESSKSSKAEEGLLFDGAPVLSPLGSRKKAEKPKAASIFDDDGLNAEDDDDDYDSLFKSSKPTPPKGGEHKAKKSLFEEETDDEDDLFGGKSASVASAVAASAKAPPKKAQEGKDRDKDKDKQKESSPFVDPLGLITKD